MTDFEEEPLCDCIKDNDEECYLCGTGDIEDYDPNHYHSIDYQFTLKHERI